MASGSADAGEIVAPMGGFQSFRFHLWMSLLQYYLWWIVVATWKDVW